MIVMRGGLALTNRVTVCVTVWRRVFVSFAEVSVLFAASTPCYDVT
jgi:hypothetical protein